MSTDAYDAYDATQDEDGTDTLTENKPLSWNDLGQNPLADPDIADAISAVARDYAKRYAGYGADREDMAQQASLWVWEHPAKVLQYLEDEHGIRALARTLRGHLHDYGEDVKAAALGYSREDLVYYSKNQLRDLLPSVWDREAWLEKPTPDDVGVKVRKSSDPATGNNWVATLADIGQALGRLPTEDRNLLIGFHRDDITNKVMAELNGVSEQVMSYRHDRALTRLVRELGGPRPRAQHDEDCSHGWVGRSAMSNDAARALTTTDVDGLR